MDLEELTKQSQETKELKGKVFAQSEAIQALQSNTNNLEQYSCRNCVMVFRAKEEQKQDTDGIICDIATKHLSIPLQRKDIDRSHRL